MRVRQQQTDRIDRPEKLPNFLAAVSGKQMIRWLTRLALIVAALLVLLYVGDYLSVRLPIPKERAAFSTVTVRPYYDVKLKSGKSDFYFLDPQPQTCVNSVFPHMGFTPCWYLRKHTRPRISM